jgi:hypothetical protein
MFAAAAIAIGSIAAIGCSAPVAEQASTDSASTEGTGALTNAFISFRSWFGPAPVRVRAVYTPPVVRYNAPAVVRYSAPAPSYGVHYAPPAPRYERVSRAPSNRHFYVSGRWQWTGSKYTWVGGHWDTQRNGYVYVQGHWNEANHHWYYKPGHWQVA